MTTNVGIRGAYFWPGWDPGASSTIVDPVVVSESITLFHLYWPIRITPNRVQFRAESAVTAITAVGIYSSDGATRRTSGKISHSAVGVQTITLSPIVELLHGMLTIAFTTTNADMSYRGMPMAAGLSALLNGGDVPWISRAVETTGVTGVLPAAVTRDSNLSALNGLPWLNFLADSTLLFLGDTAYVSQEIRTAYVSRE